MDSISRHEQLLRVFHLIDILFGAREPQTTAELKAALRERGVIDEMSDKNIRRDVLFLEKFGYAVRRSGKRSDRGTTRAAWSIQPGRGMRELTPPAVSLPELLSLAVARDFLAPLAGTFYWRGIGQLLSKLESIATPELIAYVNEHKDGLVVHPRPPRPKYGTRMLAAIHRAIRNRVELRIRYQALGADAHRPQTIRPEAMVLYEGSLYIAGRRASASKSSRDGGETIRFYKLDRVADARPTSKVFERGRVPVDTLLADSITIYRSPEPPRPFRIRIDAARARWARERPFHPRQKVRGRGDGGITLVIDRGWEAEIVPQVLALGEHAEILEPHDVRQRVAATILEMAARYMPGGARGIDAEEQLATTVFE